MGGNFLSAVCQSQIPPSAANVWQRHHINNNSQYLSTRWNNYPSKLFAQQSFESWGNGGAAIKAVLQEPAFSKWHLHVWLVCCMSCPYYALSGIDHVVTLSENPNSGLPARPEENPSDPPTVSAHKPIKPLAASIPFFLANWGALATEHNGALQKTTSTMTR